MDKSEIEKQIIAKREELEKYQDWDVVLEIAHDIRQLEAQLWIENEKVTNEPRIQRI